MSCCLEKTHKTVKIPIDVDHKYSTIIIYVVVILCLPGVYTEYTTGRHWIAYLSHSNLLEASGRSDQTATYIIMTGYVQKLVGLFVEC